MQKPISQPVRFTIVSILIVLILLLSGCGGGGGGNKNKGVGGTTRLLYPDCSLGVNGTDGLAGCWVSEACGTGSDVEETWAAQGVRYLSRISEDQVIPTVQGSIEHYYLRYNNDQCAGTPFAIVDQQKILAIQGFEWIVQYQIPGFETCTDRADTAITPTSILCTALDLASAFRPLGATSGGESTAFGAYDDAIIENRLCMSGDMYTGFDPADVDDFSIGPTDLTTRGTDLDYLNCLTRFSP